MKYSRSWPMLVFTLIWSVLWCVILKLDTVFYFLSFVVLFLGVHVVYVALVFRESPAFDEFPKNKRELGRHISPLVGVVGIAIWDTARSVLHDQPLFDDDFYGFLAIALLGISHSLYYYFFYSRRELNTTEKEI